MPTETALAYLRAAAAGSPRLPAAVVIFGPNAFLREYVLSSVVRALARRGWKHRGFQIGLGTGGSGDDFGAVLGELRAPDLFAPKVAVVCRVGRARRGRDDDAGADTDARPSGGAGEAALATAMEGLQGDGSRIVLLYERDNAPAKIRRAVEKSALFINCTRPFDNQIADYAKVFAESLDLKADSAAIDTLVGRYGSDLGAIANALEKAAIFAGPGQSIGRADLDEPGTTGARRMPEAFEIADSIARGRTATAVSQVDRAVALGRDTIEILAVEVIPAMRRMMIAASLMAAKKGQGDVAAALGFPPQSMMAARAIEGAKRFGIRRLERAYWRACEMDAQFKNGRLKEREEALSGLLLDLMGAPE
ncbi:MAG TPA: hypothetical protein VMU16_13930 [Candidatus Binataceae bacterium]|nr:hypothetical protein [Candidatus Binataceae bacterium]